MLRVVAVILGLLGPAISTAAAQEAQRGSECLAMAQVPPRATPVSLRRLAAKAEEVTITYAGHSTYYIDTPGGVRIATDFSGGMVRDNPEVNKHIAELTALGRTGLPEDIGSMIASLLSEDNRWVNAQRIEVSGGLAI